MNKTRGLTLHQRIALWDGAFTGIRRHFQAAGLREVSTSSRGPELEQLLAHGSGPIYQIAHADRTGHVDAHRREELQRLDWYRLGDSNDEVLSDVEAVVGACFAAAGRAGPSRWLRVSVLDLMQETAGLPLDSSWTDRFLVPWLAARPECGVHLCDLPDRRFESYVGGTACAQGRREPGGQEERPGLPDCSGASIGLDRLMMTAAAAQSLEAISTDRLPTTPGAPARPTLRTTRSLVAHGLVDAGEAEALAPVMKRFQLAISPTMQQALAREPAGGPLQRQFVPDRRELLIAPQERADPIGDESFSPVKGLVHRYPDRVLLLPTLLCPVYCRFCFRREVVGGAGVLRPEQLDAAIAYLRERPAIREVILTGGDPLILSAHRVGALLDTLASIPHIKVIRIHTRVPLVSPERITRELVQALRVRPALYVLLHSNHAGEFTEEGRAAIARIVDAGIPMLSQTVLLKGINDDLQTLESLLRTLVENRVKPYYLHHPDLAEGTGHFRVSLEEGRRLVQALRGNVSGLCQPTYVLDIPGGHGKVPVGPSFIHGGPRHYQLRDRSGGVHLYEDLADGAPGQRPPG